MRKQQHMLIIPSEACIFANIAGYRVPFREVIIFLRVCLANHTQLLNMEAACIRCYHVLPTTLQSSASSYIHFGLLHNICIAMYTY